MLYRPILLVLAAVSILHLPAVAPAFPATSNGDADNVRLLSRWAHGPCGDVTAAGDTVLHADGGLIDVVDYTDPAAPVPLASLALPALPARLVPAGSRIVVTDLRHDLMIVDVADLGAPVLAGRVTLDDEIVAVAAAGDWIHVQTVDHQTWEHVLVPIDMTDPGAPVVHAGTLLGFSGAEDMAAADGLLAICDFDSTRLLDLADPTAPAVLASVPVPGQRILTDGGLAYVANTDWSAQASLHILDIVGPGAPSVVGHLSWPSLDYAGFMKGIALKDGRLHCIDDRGDLSVLDVSDPASPALLGSHDGREGSGLAATTSRLFCALEYDEGLAVLDATDPQNIVETGDVPTGRPLYGVAVDRGRAYVSAHEDMIDILDVSDPLAPFKLGRFDSGGEVWGLDAYRDHLYVCNDVCMLMVVDVSDPAAPAITDQLGTGIHDGPVIERDGLVHIAGDGGLYIVDVSDPHDILLAGSCGTGSTLNDIALDGDHCYGVAEGSFFVVDVADPAAPVVVHTSPLMGWGGGVAAVPGFVYVSDTFEESSPVETYLWVYDAADPTAPVIVGGLALPPGAGQYDQAGRGIVADGDYLYLTAFAQGVLVYDIQDPGAPVEYGYYDTGDYAMGLAATGNLVYAADRDDGLWILRNTGIPVGVEPVPLARQSLLQNAPNPFNPVTRIRFELAAPTRVRLAVHDVAGRRVATLVDGTLPSGPHVRSWSGRGDDGREMPSGVYLYRLETPLRAETRKMLLLK